MTAMAEAYSVLDSVCDGHAGECAQVNSPPMMVLLLLAVRPGSRLQVGVAARFHLPNLTQRLTTRSLLHVASPNSTSACTH